MKKAFSIAGVVVLYNPPADFTENILLYLDKIDRLYVIDNSEKNSHQHEAQLHGRPKIIYRSNKENLGIAKALNMGAEHALKDGYDFLLTMDQDSKAAPGMIDVMMACIEAFDSSRIGILSPLQIYTSYQDKPIDKPCEEVLTAMTSGCLLNLKAFRITGPFLEKLFIDCVDHEYCMRLHLNKFKIIRVNNAHLYHSLGSVSEHRLLFKKFAIGNHPPIRRYYTTRNKFYLYNRYRGLLPGYFHALPKYVLYEIISIIMYERDKFSKLTMMLKGYRDYKKGVLGKYEPRHSSSHSVE